MKGQTLEMLIQEMLVSENYFCENDRLRKKKKKKKKKKQKQKKHTHTNLHKPCTAAANGKTEQLLVTRKGW